MNTTHIHTPKGSLYELDEVSVGKDVRDSRLVKLSCGTPIEGVILGKVAKHDYHWVGGYEMCTGTRECPYCGKGRTQVRFAVNFFDMSGIFTDLKVLELPPIAIAKLQRVISQHGKDIVIKIIRDVYGEGEKKQTRYDVRFVRTLTSDEQKEFGDMELYNLEAVLGEIYFNLMGSHAQLDEEVCNG